MGTNGSPDFYDSKWAAFIYKSCGFLQCGQRASKDSTISPKGENTESLIRMFFFGFLVLFFICPSLHNSNFYSPGFWIASLVDGYNLPLRITNNVGCPVADCAVDLGPNCELFLFFWLSITPLRMFFPLNPCFQGKAPLSKLTLTILPQPRNILPRRPCPAQRSF